MPNDALETCQTQRDALLAAAKEAREVVINALTMLAHIEQTAPEPVAAGVHEFWVLMEQRGHRDIGTRLDRAIAEAEGEGESIAHG